MDKETREKILENMTTESDFRNQVDYARKEGRAEGLAEAQIEIARKSKALGVEI